ncbi:uncharacterized protein E0L32_005520 [Thyridium curvatum]|uniref:COP9 signalosome complex subunit 1 n=1 Tax=Thyridium curvatum TaxID=1093900 RepID=A0A507B6P0_9PEZI|nr:uncharacterized protein E0L32_005520 [Thyridium curvatum]TPX14324.1 hypothetical protein E0L32_005520 [Thyridium curvatum]
MADPNTAVQTFFSMMEDQGGVVVKDPPKFDLEAYISNYQGRTRFDRLLLIGKCSKVLCVDALKAAVSEALSGKDVQRYREAWDCIRVAGPNEPEAVFDEAWVKGTVQSNAAETHRLEAELRGYKNNLIKESIRMGNEDLGRHLEATGDLSGAVEAYSRMRPDISTAKHIIDVGKHLVDLAVQRREWGHVIANAAKISGFPNPDDDKVVQPYLRTMQGIGLLGQGKYREAAYSFLMIEGAATAQATQNDFVTPNDVAVYGGLLALATMNRKELKIRVLEKSNFRAFLELEPHIRRAITQFVSGRYSACLEILESYRADYLLDIHLQKHIPTLYSQIRSKCIVQYLVPFSCVTLETMNKAFAPPGQSIEQELVAMIKSGALQARIDTIDKLVTTPKAQPKAAMQASALQTANNFEKEALDRIRRMSILSADLEVKGPRKGHSAWERSSGATESWYAPDQAEMD